MKDKWFERGGFLYDITKEYGRLRKCTNILDCSENPKGNLDSWEIDLLDSLSCKKKRFVKKQLHTINDSCKRNNFDNYFTWPTGPSAIDKNLRLKVRSFIDTNYIYKLPNDWDTDRLLRYSFLWPEKHDYWPETEQLRYSIYEITKNYPVYNDWEPTIENEASKQKWLLAKDETTLTTDIVQTANPSIFNHRENVSKETFGKNYREANEKCRLKMAKEFSDEENACFKVMYTIGNIMPAGASYKPGRGAPKDTFYDKLTVIKDALNLSKKERDDKKNAAEKKEKKNEIENDEAAVLLLDRLGYFGETEKQDIWNKFIENHYLQDFVKKANNNYTDPIIIDNPADLAKRIIQRGYRIYYQYERDDEGNIKYEDDQPKINSKLFNNNYSFTEYSKGYLAAIFESVGIPDDNLNLI